MTAKLRTYRRDVPDFYVNWTEPNFRDRPMPDLYLHHTACIVTVCTTSKFWTSPHADIYLAAPAHHTSYKPCFGAHNQRHPCFGHFGLRRHQAHKFTSSLEPSLEPTSGLHPLAQCACFGRGVDVDVLTRGLATLDAGCSAGRRCCFTFPLRHFLLDIN